MDTFVKTSFKLTETEDCLSMNFNVNLRIPRLPLLLGDPIVEGLLPSNYPQAANYQDDHHDDHQDDHHDAHDDQDVHNNLHQQDNRYNNHHEHHHDIHQAPVAASGGPQDPAKKKLSQHAAIKKASAVFKALTWKGIKFPSLNPFFKFSKQTPARVSTFAPAPVFKCDKSNFTFENDIQETVQKSKPAITLHLSKAMDYVDQDRCLFNCKHCSGENCEKPFNWSGLWCFLIGVTEIAAGATLCIVYPLGAGMGLTFVAEGLNDCYAGLDAMITGGEFNWLEWSKAKAVSIGAGIFSLGVGKFFNL